MRKAIPISCAIIIAFLVGIYIIWYRPRNIDIIVIQKPYNIISLIDEEDVIKIHLLINYKDSYFTDKSQISDCLLTDESRNNLINLELHDIEMGGKRKYKNDYYYDCIMIFKINFKADSDICWEINNVYLCLSYYNDLNSALEIGSLSYYKISSLSNNEVAISSLKGIMTNINGSDNYYLGAIIIGLRNNTNTSLVIKNIEFLDCNIKLAKGYKKISGDENKSLDEYLGYSYNLVSPYDGKMNITINEGNSDLYIIPIYYNNLALINGFGLKIELFENNEVLYFDKFIYFDYSNQIIDEQYCKLYSYLYD